jgi:DNA polymerase-1
MQGAKGAQAKIFSETGIEYPVKTVQKVMDVYYSLFPKIKQWHKNVLDEAEKDGYLRNPFDYVHRFNRPYDYKKEFGEWVKKPGPDANKVIAFKPQSTAVGIITEAILRIYFERFEEAGTFLRLQVHDELLFEILRNEWERVDKVVQEEMEKPVPQMRLPASWGMGEYLNILTEAKADLNQPSRWGSMKGL